MLINLFIFESMKLGILSRGPQLYSTQALAQSAKERGHDVRIIDHLYCDLVLGNGSSDIHYGNEKLNDLDAIIPRIGASVTFHGAALIRQFELMKIFTAVSSEALLQSRDKLRCLQILNEAGLDMPRTAFSNYCETPGSLIEKVGGTPAVIKLLKGTHGLGVILAKDDKTAESILEAFIRTREKVIIQEYIGESKGEDLRALVVDGKVVAAMKRKALPGEFRSNLHRGASAIHVKLDEAEEAAALKSVEALGLAVAGVDMLQSDRGPLVLEVNPSPGLEGITKTTGIDVADQIITYVEAQIEMKQ